MTYHFPRTERLRRKKHIDSLFRHGKRWHGPLLTLYYLPCEQAQGQKHQVLFAVPKSKIKKAVHRNKIKRRLREAYRHHKHLMTEGQGTLLHLGYVYKGKQKRLPTYHTLLQEIKASIEYLNKKNASLKKIIQ